LNNPPVIERQLPFGAEVLADGVDFRVWAPLRKAVQVIIVDACGNELARRDMKPESNGSFSRRMRNANPGTLYTFQLDDDPKKYPDPASRFQPQGVHGPSQVIDPGRFEWSDEAWPGVQLKGQVLYELHIGTFTLEGTWTAATEKLRLLLDLGITLIEVMPIAAFPGMFGWGYDGTYWFAPTQLYGGPDDFRMFVDQAHRLGIGVILDVVYNHFGPSGNYTGEFSPYFRSTKHHTDWGDAINFDGENCEPVREFVASNAAYWIREYHLDGLRLDALHSIIDESKEHIISRLTREARSAAGNRTVLIFGENEFQQVHYLVRREEGGYGIDGLWNDDFHHACRVAATGNTEGYYGDYLGTPHELVSAIRLGYLYQGQWNARQVKGRGSPSRNIAAPKLVHFLQNHDQVANSARGLRTHALTTPGRQRALTALLLLGPETPMLFMGQEFNASNPFQFFADHDPELARLIRRGRRESMWQFPSAIGFDGASKLADPSDPATFAASKIDWSERERNMNVVDLHRDLLELRRNDAVFSQQDKAAIEGSAIGPEAFLLRWFDAANDDRLALFNLGRQIDRYPPAEPLLAPPPNRQWQLLWSSEDPQYGGKGTPPFHSNGWQVPAHAAVLFRAVDGYNSYPK
jgi:maltooligosyltrehalose trehalohydrolase